MSMLSLTPTFAIPAGCSAVIEATSNGIYLYAGKSDESAPGEMKLLDDKHATKIITWDDLYQYDGEERDLFIAREWESLLASI